MLNSIGYSVFLSTFKNQKEQLSSLYKEGNFIFTSFHISEEYDNTYIQRAKDMCTYLKTCGYRIIADVSISTLKLFHAGSLLELAKMLNISILRIDYGFSEDEILKLAKEFPVCINASTVTSDFAEKLSSNSLDIYAMHNYYPRPETGLDEEQFQIRNKMLLSKGFKLLAFIPGDADKRGPIYEGLPTLEAHRYIAPYAAFISLLSYNIDGVFIGDGIISQFQANMISQYQNSNIYTLPVIFEKEYEYLYNKEFTIRTDSPSWLKRLQESRVNGANQDILPNHCTERTTGSITIDNNRYQRYSGEIQIIVENLPADERVNVIGQLPKEYHLLLKNIMNGSKIRFVKPMEESKMFQKEQEHQ